MALFRGGCDDAFRAIHDRYRVRLLAYARQMLGGSTADAEDALQEVFVRAHAALLTSSSPISLRAWLYRIAHNRCIDQLRRPLPIPSEILPGAQPALSRGPRHDPSAEAERGEDLRRLIGDVRALPEQQRSALLMRELQGLSYEELALALGISVAAVKSVLLRARGGMLDAVHARDAPCTEIRLELVSAHDRGVRASGRARRHMRECACCRSYRGELRAVSRQVAALAPGGPLGHLGLVFGLGGGGAGGGLAAGGSTAVLGGAASLTATKVAALVCCAALVGSAGALRSQSPRHHVRAPRAAPAHRAPAAAMAPSPRVVARIAGGTIAPAQAPARTDRPAPPARAPSDRSQPPLTGQDSYGSLAPTPQPAGATPTGAPGPAAAPGGDAAGGAAATASPAAATAPGDATGGQGSATPPADPVARSSPQVTGRGASPGTPAPDDAGTPAPAPAGTTSTRVVDQTPAPPGRMGWSSAAPGQIGWSRPAAAAAGAKAQ